MPKLNQKQIDLLNKQKIIVLSTSDKNNQPRAIFVEANKIEDDKIIITDGAMKITNQNIKENKNVFVLSFENNYSYGLKISGKAEYFSEGKYFEYVKNLEENKKYSPKGAIVIEIEKIEEF
jgi:predicted pyridoxine 5'-phosphate oxidase superfamily flavin-nucleotide-binding protein